MEAMSAILVVASKVTGKSQKQLEQQGCKAAAERLEHWRDLDRKAVEGCQEMKKAGFVNTHRLALEETRYFFPPRLADRQATAQRIPSRDETVL